MSNIFSQTEVLSLPRSFQKMSYTLKTSLDYGKLYPVFAMSCVPGDTLRVYGALNIRAKPMVTPNLTPNKCTVHFFFVPYRLLDENFSQGITGTTEKGEAVNYEFPKWEISATATKSKTLWDYFGLPINVTTNASGLLEEDTTNVKGVEPTKYLKRAYNLIFNTMYRNENLVDEVNIDSNDLQYRCWRADYFTKALPWQQKPSESNYFALPVNSALNGNDNDVPFRFYSEDALDKSFDNPKVQLFRTTSNITVASDSIQNFNIKKYRDNDQNLKALSYRNSVSGNNFQIISTNGDPVGYTSYDGSTNSTVNFKLPADNIAQALDISSTSFDISDLRLAVQMQKWAERNARGGTRYDEMIKAHFGITPRDARLQLPEFIGGFKFPILCGENYSTSETEYAPQGTRAGIGNGVGADRTKQYFVEEYGIILGIASILPQAEYQQGINRQWILHDQLDFYHHELCCLSEREVYQGELVCSNSTDNEIAEKHNKTNFGFTGIYNEYRYMPNIITGEMRIGTYAQWHQSRIMDAGYDTTNEHPNTVLNQNFVEARNVAKRPFAELDGSDPFIVQGKFSIRAFRPMTYRAEPGLIDHF